MLIIILKYVNIDECFDALNFSENGKAFVYRLFDLFSNKKVPSKQFVAILVLLVGMSKLPRNVPFLSDNFNLSKIEALIQEAVSDCFNARIE